MLCRNRGQGQRTGSLAETRPDGIAAMHRGTAARHPIETGQGGVVARAAASAWNRNCQNAARERSFHPAETKSMQAPLKQSLMTVQPCTGTGCFSGTGMRILRQKQQKSVRKSPSRPFFTGSGLPSGRRTPSMRFLPKQSRQKWRGTQFLAEPGKGSKGTIRRRNWEKGPRPMGALKCVRPVRAGAAAGSRRLRRPHSIPPAAGPSCAAPACP